MTRMKIGTVVSAIAFSAAAALSAGCADISMPWAAAPASSSRSQADPPRLAECAVVSISTPSKYACGGKVYTSYQLAKLRGEEIKKYESGK